ncbi:alpha/beta fold hydrolase [Pseudoalteromonas phenolica]|uniref:alpha/beta fold hydrolase n=1 Tax=Pseudoalteromonas phenolica TaxID=161398 RepID=UPI001486B03D|nr:alpha/beta fold hydrolase [Pseudoalteromonas phenolica]
MKTPINKLSAISVCLLSLFSFHETQANTLSQSQIHRLEQLETQQQVKQVVVEMVNAIDSKQWSIAQSHFADKVFVDYSSMTGQAGSEVAATDLVGGWQSLLTQVETHHLLSNFDIQIDGNNAQMYSHVYASHTAQNIPYWDIYGRYFHKLQKVDEQWLITDMTLLTHGQKGNLNFLQEVSQMQQADNSSNDAKSLVQKVSFLSEGEKVVGDLYLPKDFDANKSYPAIIVSGSWTTVKEQMAGLYAEKLSQQGFVALAFDFRNFGESEGEARFYENPKQKVIDIKHAVSFVQTLSMVDKDKVGALGICAGAMYTLMAASEDTRIKSVVTAASWLHDAEAVKMFYGGEAGVKAKVTQAQQAKKKYQLTGEIEYIPSISTTDESAAMYGPYDYYLNPERGALPQWSDDKFAVMTWEDWLTLDPMPSAKGLTTPTLMVHSDGAVLPHYTKQYFENIAASDKKLHWIDTELESPYHQFSFYDQVEEVNESINEATKWFNQHL